MTKDTLEMNFNVDLLRSDAARIYKAQKAFFDSGATRPYGFRKAQLKQLKAMIIENEGLICEALKKDLRKSDYECVGTEIGPTVSEIRHALSHLRDWMRPEHVSTPLMFQPSRSRIYRDPLGIVLTIGPWNYPFMLLMTSVVSAIAGGNTMILKPSDFARHTEHLITKLVRQYFPEHYMAVIEGPGHIVGAELIEQYHFDHIFFTGSIPVGKRIMEMAARHLSPVTLELGGKSPCIVDQTANLDFAARKIAWSKLINAGQTCVAPDYLLVHEAVKEKFLEKLKSNFTRMLGADPAQSPDFGRLINRKRYDTLLRYMQQGKIVYGGQHDPEELFIAPTILEGISTEDSVMQEEIFGPVLPIITYRNREEVLNWIEENPYPLALYVYSADQKTSDFYIQRVRFGGGCVNNGVIHLGNPDLPFGGVGYSGMGQYHGKFGFDVMTRPKSVMYTPTWIDAPLWYAPYGNAVKWIRKLFGL
jgi:aldehyde dehydrogenase (NAD+)